MSYINFYYCSGMAKNAHRVEERAIDFIPKDRFGQSGPRLRDLEGFFITELPIQRRDMMGVPESRLPELENRYHGKLTPFSGFEDPDIKVIYNNH